MMGKLGFVFGEWILRALRDVRELHEGQAALTTRVSSVEESLRASHVNEFIRRIIFIEERIGFGGGGDCRVRLNQCTAGLQDLRDCMRTQEWYHDLSDRELFIGALADYCDCSE